MLYEVVIVGGGPAGTAAAVYAARKKMKTLLITEGFGGQSIVSSDIGNWIGDISVSGFDLAQRFEKHVRSQEDINVNISERAENISLVQESPVPLYEVKTNKGTYQTYSVIVTTGGRRRKLGVPGEKELDGRGVAYCSTCDAPFFRGRDVIVVGSGNSALEGVLDLNSYANKIFLFNRSDVLRGDPQTQEHVQELEKVTIFYEVEILEILGENSISGVKYIDKKSSTKHDMPIGGVFVEIGSLPNSELVADLVDLTKEGEIIVDHRLFTTSRKGIFAAGDVTDVIYKQNNISAGDAVAATLSCYDYIQRIRKKLGTHK